MTTPNITTVNTAAGLAYDAIEAGNLTEAIKQLRKVRALLVALPNTAKANASLSFDRNAIGQLIRDLQAQLWADKAATTGGIVQRQEITYKRVT